MAYEGVEGKFPDVCGVEGKDKHGAVTGEGLRVLSHWGGGKVRGHRTQVGVGWGLCNINPIVKIQVALL